MKTWQKVLLILGCLVVGFLIFSMIAVKTYDDHIDDAKDSANQRTAELVVSSVELAYESARLKNNGYPTLQQVKSSFNSEVSTWESDYVIQANNFKCDVKVVNNNLKVNCLGKETTSEMILSNEVVNNPIQLKNYDINNIKNIEVRVPIKNATDPEMKQITITDKEEIKSILLSVDDIKEVGKVPEGIGFMFNVTIKVNYNGDPSTNIVILDNGNIAINKAVGVGETGYGEYEISNKSLATQLTDKYQN